MLPYLFLFQWMTRNQQGRLTYRTSHCLHTQGPILWLGSCNPYCSQQRCYFLHINLLEFWNDLKQCGYWKLFKHFLLQPQITFPCLLLSFPKSRNLPTVSAWPAKYSSVIVKELLWWPHSRFASDVSLRDGPSKEPWVPIVEDRN